MFYTPPADALFTTLDSTQSGLNFVNRVAGDNDFNVLSYRNFFNGAGVAITDLNGDGKPDLYFTANQGPNRLYLNQGDWQFTEVTDAGGAAGTMFWSTGVTAVDVNADGKQDLYVCNSGEIDGSRRTNELFINLGNDEAGRPRFAERAAEYGLDDPGFGTQAAWFDYDGDGDLDVYLLNNSYLDPDRIAVNDKKRDKRQPDGGDKLLRNDLDVATGHPVFTDVSEAAGIYGSNIGFGLGVGLGDLDGNGWTDLYISNDFWERDYLYLNQGDGTFVEDLNRRMNHISTSSMGSDVADLDNDGDLDIFSTDMLPGDNYRLKAATVFDSYNTDNVRFRADYHYQILQNCLQLNDGAANFQEVANFAGVAATDWSWGALLFDLDNDGRKDIFVANGIYQDIMFMDFTDFVADRENVKKVVMEKGRYDWRDFAEYLPSTPLANYAFLQNSPLQFEDKAAELGLGRPGFSNGAAYGDLDGDGDYDLVINNLNGAASLYRNESRAGYLGVRLRGGEQNPAAVGARLTLLTDRGSQVLEKYPARGYLSTVGEELIFGLGSDGEATSPIALRVDWPDRRPPTLLKAPNPNTYLDLNPDHPSDLTEAQWTDLEGMDDEETAITVQAPARPQSSLASVSHQDEVFSDFDVEPLLYRMLSTPGPVLAQADVNGDGQTDLLVGGGPGQADQLWLGQADGGYRAAPSTALAATAARETSAAAFFDRDGDGDPDLLLGSGGNDIRRGKEAYTLRYYENLDGKFLENPMAAPPGGGEISCLLPADVDGDGDIDVFVGGRAIPSNYGLPPQSFLLMNQGSRNWTVATPPWLERIGMVTAGAWTDVDTDGRPDLVLMGDWMPLTICYNRPEGLSEPVGLDGSYGWWNTLIARDLDGDGDNDLVAGNWGLNSKFTASEELPLELYVKDFDGNGKSEFILNWRPPLETQRYPFVQKNDLHRQLPSLRKRTLKYDDYARQTYQSLFTEEEQAGALRLRAEELRSCVFWNDGGSFRKQALPDEAQLAPIFAGIARDLNADGRVDLWLGGNLYGTPPQSGRQDAGRGLVLLQTSTGEWQLAKGPLTEIDAEVRSALVLPGPGNSEQLVVGVNNGALRVFGLPTLGTATGSR